MSHAKDFSLESANSVLCDADWHDQLVLDYRKLPLPDALRAMCDFAVKLTVTPGDMSAADTGALRAFEWTDEQITICTQIISYFNYINRIADGLGVEPEPWMQLDSQVWLDRKTRWSSFERPVQ